MDLSEFPDFEKYKVKRKGREKKKREGEEKRKKRAKKRERKEKEKRKKRERKEKEKGRKGGKGDLFFILFIYLFIFFEKKLPDYNYEGFMRARLTQKKQKWKEEGLDISHLEDENVISNFARLDINNRKIIFFKINNIIFFI